MTENTQVSDEPSQKDAEDFVKRVHEKDTHSTYHDKMLSEFFFATKKAGKDPDDEFEKHVVSFYEQYHPDKIVNLTIFKNHVDWQLPFIGRDKNGCPIVLFSIKRYRLESIFSN